LTVHPNFDPFFTKPAGSRPFDLRRRPFVARLDHEASQPGALEPRTVLLRAHYHCLGWEAMAPDSEEESEVEEVDFSVSAFDKRELKQNAQTHYHATAKKTDSTEGLDCEKEPECEKSGRVCPVTLIVSIRPFLVPYRQS
jgi:hypothetical protein